MTPTNPRPSGPARKIWTGDREVVSYGIARQFWQDIYHEALTMRWPVFFSAVGGLFLLLNAAFAALYQLGHEAIGNQSPAGFLGAFFFSVETLATVGYGNMYPQTTYGHCIALTEIFVGMMGLAVVTGLVFARFSRPRAKILFARHPVVGFFDGRRTLMIRAANARQNVIADASARLRLLLTETTPEGGRFRRVHDLSLVRNEHPAFMLGWVMMHVLDERSPLAGLDAAQLATRDAALILSMQGVDDATSQSLQARHYYSHGDLRWEHRYADIMTLNTAGTTEIDYSRFHDVEPL